jgi:bifunctional non-homologous end joining protein LigD
MMLQRTAKLPEGDLWRYEIKWDGYRAIAFTTGGKVSLRSRNDNDFSVRYARVTAALAKLPDDTVLDGEIVALDASGRPSFSALQNYGTGKATVFFYVFDVLVFEGKDVMGEPLRVRHEMLETNIMPLLSEPIRYAGTLDAPLSVLISSVKEQGLEGLVAKRLDSRYEPGQRSGSWQKMRLNQGQEFVIGGYTVGGRTFDAVVFGYYEGKDLRYAAKTRNGFTPASRADLMTKFTKLTTQECPFTGLPEKRSGRWGEGLTAEKMKDCRWLTPSLVGMFEFVEWTPDDHLRHASFLGLREDKDPRSVVQEP